jgi:hypothetical protein
MDVLKYLHKNAWTFVFIIAGCYGVSFSLRRANGEKVTRPNAELLVALTT